MTALYHLAALILHIIAQIIEAELVIGAVGNVAAVSGLPLVVIKAVLDDAHGETEEVIKLAHGFGIAAGEVIIDRHHMHALAFKRVEVNRQRRHQRLAFTRAHFSNAAFMQDHAADQLYVERTHTEHALGGFTRRCKSVRQQVVELLAFCECCAKFRSLRLKLFVGDSFVILLKRSNLFRTSPQ